MLTTLNDAIVTNNRITQPEEIEYNTLYMQASVKVDARWTEHLSSDGCVGDKPDKLIEYHCQYWSECEGGVSDASSYPHVEPIKRCSAAHSIQFSSIHSVPRLNTSNQCLTMDPLDDPLSSNMNQPAPSTASADEWMNQLLNPDTNAASLSASPSPPPTESVTAAIGSASVEQMDHATNPTNASFQSSMQTVPADSMVTPMDTDGLASSSTSSSQPISSSPPASDTASSPMLSSNDAAAASSPPVPTPSPTLLTPILDHSHLNQQTESANRSDETGSPGDAAAAAQSVAAASTDAATATTAAVPMQLESSISLSNSMGGGNRAAATSASNGLPSATTLHASTPLPLNGASSSSATNDVERHEEDEEDARVAMYDAESSDSDVEIVASGRRRRSASHRTSLADYEDEDEDEYDGYDSEEYAAATGMFSARDLEYQHELESAAACGLPPSYMHPLEQKYLPEFIPYHTLYVELRNTICHQWQRSVTHYLSFDDCCQRSRIQDSLRHCAKRVFDFLNVHGFINCGLLPVKTDNGGEHGLRPVEQQRPPYVINLPTVRRKDANHSHQNGDGNANNTPLSPSRTPSTSVLLSTPPASSPTPFSFKRIVIIGAGASGMAAARQLRSFGHHVTVLEGRDRVGGRAHTIRDKFSAPVDLGASIMTGLYGSPLNVLCKQHTGQDLSVGFSTRTLMGNETVKAPARPFPAIMHYIGSSCPIYDSNGKPVEQELDTKVENLFNKLLEAEYIFKLKAGFPCEAPAEDLLSADEKRKLHTADVKDLSNMDVQSGMNMSRKLLGVRLSSSEEKILDWHAANLEYGCATALKNLSLAHWDQDDAMAWEGDHALIKPGFGTFVEILAKDIDVRFNQHVHTIEYERSDSTDEESVACVRARDTSTGEEQSYPADIVVCTASLGVLKSGSLRFDPPLPPWKQSAISSLGFGLLNKLILEFDTPFWKKNNDIDTFGYVNPGESKDRGKFYIFWNLERSTGRPILAALCAGEAAFSMESCSESSLVTDCMAALRAIHSDVQVNDPIRTHQTKWSQDPYARGSYSFVAVGNNGKEYDVLAQPVGSNLYFAGEACNRDYPATVPGAYLSGLRSAGVIQSHIFSWLETPAPAEVLRELERQKKSTTSLSKADNMANAVTQQAMRELNREGRQGDDALQQKVAEILARQQQRRRRGIRHEAFHSRVDEEQKRKEQQYRESIARKLAQAADLLKRGMFAPPRENVKKEAPVLDNSSYAYAWIKQHEGELERPFDAQQQDNQGLPGVMSFQEFDLTVAAPATAASSSSSSHHHRSHHSRSHKSHKRDKYKRRAEHGRHGADRAHKKRKGENGASRTPESHIKRYIAKVVEAARPQLPASFSSSSSSRPSKLLKKVYRKSVDKVVADWNSKPRGDLPVATWLNDKRKASIQTLVNKYIEAYVAHTEGKKSGQQPHDRRNGTQ